MRVSSPLRIQLEFLCFYSALWNYPVILLRVTLNYVYILFILYSDISLINILPCVRGSVINNNEFWVR
jgi:hypothetical protein